MVNCIGSSSIVIHYVLIPTFCAVDKPRTTSRDFLHLCPPFFFYNLCLYLSLHFCPSLGLDFTFFHSIPKLSRHRLSQRIPIKLLAIIDRNPVTSITLWFDSTLPGDSRLAQRLSFHLTACLAVMNITLWLPPAATPPRLLRSLFGRCNSLILPSPTLPVLVSHMPFSFPSPCPSSPSVFIFFFQRGKHILSTLDDSEHSSAELRELRPELR